MLFRMISARDLALHQTFLAQERRLSAWAFSLSCCCVNETTLPLSLSLHLCNLRTRSMKMKSLSVCTAAFVCLGVCSVVAQANATECPAYIPAGVVIRVLPDEKLTAGSSSGPTILTVSSDVRFFPNRPPLLARGSKVLGTIVESKKAGHFHGKARLRITLGSILSSDFCEYPIDGKIV